MEPARFELLQESPIKDGRKAIEKDPPRTIQDIVKEKIVQTNQKINKMIAQAHSHYDRDEEQPVRGTGLY